MRYIFCESEEPQEHWGFLQVIGKRVLDLGCGYFGGAHGQPTPTWFVEQGASAVVGVDATLDNLQHITDPAIALLQLSIGDKVEIENLITRFEPDVVKCDIEGGEVHLLGMSPAVLTTVDEYAVETHTDELYDAAWLVFREHGYKIKTIVDLMNAAPCKVVHAVRA